MKIENWEIAFSLEMQSSHFWDLQKGHYNRQSAGCSCALDLPVGFFYMRSSDLIAFISNKLSNLKSLVYCLGKDLLRRPVADPSAFASQDFLNF